MSDPSLVILQNRTNQRPVDMRVEELVIDIDFPYEQTCEKILHKNNTFLLVLKIHIANLASFVLSEYSFADVVSKHKGLCTLLGHATSGKTHEARRSCTLKPCWLQAAVGAVLFPVGTYYSYSVSRLLSAL